MQTADQLLAWQRDGGWKHLLTHSEGFRAVTLSDDFGTAVFYTGQNRLLRMALANGELTELYGPLPADARQMTLVPVPGAVLRLQGGGFSTGVTLRSAGYEFPLVARQDTLADFQFPWEFPLDETTAAGRTISWLRRSRILPRCFRPRVRRPPALPFTFT